MNVLLGFVNATAGAAFLFGVNVREPIARQRIGYLPELTYYYKFLTAEELLRFYARIFGIPKPETDRRIDAALKLVELAEQHQGNLEQLFLKVIGYNASGVRSVPDELAVVQPAASLLKRSITPT